VTPVLALDIHVLTTEEGEGVNGQERRAGNGLFAMGLGGFLVVLLVAAVLQLLAECGTGPWAKSPGWSRTASMAAEGAAPETPKRRWWWGAR
jgi:hypothetical protein